MGKYLSNLAKSLMGELCIVPNKELSGYFPLVHRRMRRMNAETLGKIAAAQGTAKIGIILNHIYIEGIQLGEASVTVNYFTPREMLVGVAALQVYDAMRELRKNAPR